jgi:small subunit ribosomal protein S9
MFYSMHVGNERRMRFGKMQKHRSEFTLEHAIKGTLSKNRLANAMIRKPKVYAGVDHPHTAQQLKALSTSYRVMSENLVEFLRTRHPKTSVARTRISTGTGKIVVKEKLFGEHCRPEVTQQTIPSPLKMTGISEKVDAPIHVFGGDVSGQAGAIRLGIAQTLCEMDIGLGAALKKANYLTRDGGKKERKKTGQPGARKRFEFSKHQCNNSYFCFP